MTFVFEVALQSNQMLFVLWISFIKLLKYVDFLESSFPPGNLVSKLPNVNGSINLHCIIVSDELNCDELLRCNIHGSNNTREHASPKI
jgi:hypothetical protein